MCLSQGTARRNLNGQDLFPSLSCLLEPYISPFHLLTNSVLPEHECANTKAPDLSHQLFSLVPSAHLCSIHLGWQDINPSPSQGTLPISVTALLDSLRLLNSTLRKSSSPQCTVAAIFGGPTYIYRICSETSASSQKPSWGWRQDAHPAWEGSQLPPLDVLAP